MWLFNRVSGRRQVRYSSQHVRACLDHYWRMCAMAERDIANRCENFPELAKTLYGTTNPYDALLQDEVYQGLRDNLGFWRCEQSRQRKEA